MIDCLKGRLAKESQDMKIQSFLIINISHKHISHMTPCFYSTSWQSFDFRIVYQVDKMLWVNGVGHVTVSLL